MEGRTTSQMRTAPEGALYVVSQERYGYMVRLAQHIGREDLDVRVVAGMLQLETLKRCYPHVVVDHEW